MKILVDIGHPAHVHYFKNFIWLMQKKGHEFLFTARERPNVFDLLRAYNFEYVSRGKGASNLLGKIAYIPKADFLIYKTAKKFKADRFMSFSSMYAAQASKMLGKPCITFDDTEHSTLEHRLYAPFSDIICTPTCFRKDFGQKHVRFNGYMELCYLHPRYFKPNPAVLEEVNLDQEDKFFILRFVSWKAGHDVGQKGFSVEAKLKLIKEMEKHGRVLISSEEQLSKDLEKYRAPITPEKMHDLLYYATMFVGEGATMASESAVLGTPSIYVNTLNLSYLEEQEERYGLTYNFSEATPALEKIIELLKNNNLKGEWQKRREKLIKEKIDVTEWMVEFVENFR
ncbi:MAG: DUF354 domain-containing protein [Candidatus Altiarchaeota archaeon]